MIRLMLFFSLLTITNCNKINDITFLKDYLKIENDRNYLSGFLCWNKNDLLNLTAIAFENNYRAIFYDINITKTIPDIIPTNKNLYVIDLDCENSNSILEIANDLKLFKFPRKWLALTTNDTIQNVTYLKVDSKFLLALRKYNYYELKYIYTLNTMENTIVSTNKSKWTRKSRFNDMNLALGSEERYNLRGATIRTAVVILNNDSYNHLEDYRDIHIDAVSKLNYILCGILVESLNGTNKFKFLDSWGYKQANGIYGGMLGYLITDDVDIGGTPLFMTKDRLDVVGYAAMTTKSGLKFLFRPPPLSYVSNVFILPFRASVWYSYFLLIIILTILMYIDIHFEWLIEEITINYDSLRLSDSFSETVMVTVGSVCQQGSSTEPKNLSGKILLFVSLISLMFLFVSYSANIVALLQSSATNIRTLKDLLDSPLELGVDDTPYNRFFFETATEPVRKAIYDRKIAPKGQKSNYMYFEDGVKRIQKGFFAFHMEPSTGYKLMSDYFQENEKCGLQQIAYVPVPYTWIPIQQNSTYRELFKVGFNKLHESGVQSRHYQRLYLKKPQCQTGGSSFVSVGLIDTFFAYVILCVGMFASVICLFIEIFISKKLNKF